MKQSVKIVLLGAGSREFSRGFIHDLVLEEELLKSKKLEVVLVDLQETILKERLEYANWCAEVTGAPTKFSATLNRQDELRDADFVILSVAVDRMGLWEQDFRIPISYGVRHTYGENGGPGALFHALRSFHLIFPILRDIERFCPETVLFNFTNPEARVLSAILKLTRINAIGLCHGFYSFHQLVSDTIGISPELLDIRTAGMNHFYTYYRIANTKTGKDLIPRFERTIERMCDKLPPLVRYLWRTFGVLGYVSDHHVSEYIGWAHEFMGLKWRFGIESRKIVPKNKNYEYFAGREELLRKNFEKSDLLKSERDTNKISMNYGTKRQKSQIVKSGELAVPIIADIMLDRKVLRPAVNILNTEGYIDNLSRDGCIEVPAVCGSGGIYPEFVGSLSEGFAAQIRLQHSIQSLLVEAYKQRSKKLLLQALLLDPVYISPFKAEQMLDYMLAIQSHYLPNFK